MKALRLVPVLLLLAAAMLRADFTKEQEAAMRELRKIDHFCFGGAGFAGTTSEGERNFRILFEGKEGAEAFLTVFQKGNAQAKMYALVGLRALDKPAYEKLLAEQKKSLAKLDTTTMAGCIVMTLPGKSVLDDIEKGRYDVYLKPDSTSKHP